METIFQILRISGVALLAAFAATWLVRGIMRRAGIMDYPLDARKAHRLPVAYEGGLGIWFGIVAGIVAACMWEPTFLFSMPEIYGLLIGSALTAAIGAADDVMDLRPVAKLGGQLAIGALMYWYGFRIEKISNPFGDDMQFWNIVSFTGTLLWYALMMNGINMIDGMDGLAAGIVAISAITLGFIANDLNVALAVMLCAVLFGACFGFLPFNFQPASIFMGDAGSMLLGFMLASITLLSSTKSPALLALILPMLAVGVPIFETLFAFVRRMLQGQHPFKADRRHLHHRFLSLGFSERRTVLTFYYITAYFGVTAYVLQKLEARATLPLVLIIISGMLLLVENMRFLEKKRLTERGGAPEGE